MTMHNTLGRTVAVKALPRPFAKDAQVRRRFATEARVLASFDQPHIVPIYDYVESEDVCILVMEHMPGGTVWSRFSTDGLRFEASAAIGLSTAIALDYAHQQGVLHRDIKPDNLLFSASGSVKVTDFGLARIMGDGATMITRTGQILGTPAYIAPEQALGEPTSRATDVYSLGVVLFELLSGDLPFHDDGQPLTLLLRHVNDEPRQLSDLAPDVPDALAETVMQAINRDPSKRYTSAWELASALYEAGDLLWGPTWLERCGIPVELPRRLQKRARLREALAERSPSTPMDPSVRMVRTLLPSDSLRRSNRTTSEGMHPAAVAASADSVSGFDLVDVMPIDTFLQQSGIQPHASLDGTAPAPARPRLTPVPDLASHDAPSGTNSAAVAPAKPVPVKRVPVGRVPVKRVAVPPAAVAPIATGERDATVVSMPRASVTDGSPDAGWYQDPWAVTTWRWWDGAAWTGLTA